ncbi:hypothetical protein K438DRAFT_1631655, partial [Mycena galopus ATCC 62051]
MHVNYSRERPAGGGSKKYVPASNVKPWILPTTTTVNPTDLLIFDCHIPIDKLTPDLTDDPLKIRANYPLRLLIDGLSGSNLRKIAAVHNVPSRQKDHVEAIRRRLQDHQCDTQCPESTTIYQLVADPKPAKEAQARATSHAWREAKREKKTVKAKASAALLKKRKHLRERRANEREPRTGSPSKFPPAPPSRKLRHQVITGMCDDLDPSAFEEMGCAVCGALTPRVDLTEMDNTAVNWDLLKVPGVTRKERLHQEDPITDLDGPVLADDCDRVCVDCESNLLKGVVPVRSLANNIWIGRVPWQLRDLSFAEKMLIARVRHNRCVVRVASGRGKMSANAIMFATPIVKVYN